MEGGFRFRHEAPYMSLSISILILLVFCQVFGSTCVDERGFRADLVHIDSVNSPYYPGNITFTERLQRAIKRSTQRLQVLQANSHKIAATDSVKPQDLEAPVNTGNGEFLMKLSIGTPPLSYSAIIDTGSDLTWTQCKPCTDCYKQATPIFDPSHSSTYTKVPCKNSLCSMAALPDYTCTTTGCEYSYTYGDFSGTAGILSYETFMFTSKSGTKNSAPHIAFGCGRINEGGGFNQGGGIVGLGRGPLSLITQLGQSVGNKFSYCLNSITDSSSKSSTIIFGEAAASFKGKVTGSTPLLKNKGESTYYYLSLEGISVGGKLLGIPKGTFGIHSDGTGGFIIDSGTTITYLRSAGYGALKNELVSLIGLTKADGSKIGLDLCYKTPSVLPKLPTVTFHFTGADFDLPRDNYMIVDKSGLFCLGMMASDDGVSIFGNVQQQNYQILYDLGKSMLSFSPTLCASL